MSSVVIIEILVFVLFVLLFFFVVKNLIANSKKPVIILPIEKEPQTPDSEVNRSEVLHTNPKVIVIDYIKTTGKDEYYSEKLLDPLWIKKSKEIKETQGYKCQRCDSIGQGLIELNKIDDLFEHTEFNNTFEIVKEVFENRDKYIQEFINNKLVLKDLSEYTKTEVYSNMHNLYIYSFYLDASDYEYRCEIISDYVSDFYQSEPLISWMHKILKYKVQYWAKDKLTKSANNIYILSISEKATRITRLFFDIDMIMNIVLNIEVREY